MANNSANTTAKNRSPKDKTQTDQNTLNADKAKRSEFSRPTLGNKDRRLPQRRGDGRRTLEKVSPTDRQSKVEQRAESASRGEERNSDKSAPRRFVRKNSEINRRRRFVSRAATRVNRREREETQEDMENAVIEVRRVTKVVAGGKNMRFSALVVVGDRNGHVGYALAKGMDYQDSVNKAIKKAKTKLIKIKLNENRSIGFPQLYKFKACTIYIKPAHSGTGLIAGGFLRSVLELAGVENAYTKIIGSSNKVAGVRAAIQALEKYTK